MFPLERGFHGLGLLPGVEVFQEEDSGNLPGVVQFAGATGVLVEDIVNVFEGLLEHAGIKGRAWNAGKGG